jgi:hypothetical protein
LALKEETKVDCYRCQFFYVTWDKKFPYGCKAMGFKSKGLPKEVVFESSGRQCLSFSPKAKRRR